MGNGLTAQVEKQLRDDDELRELVEEGLDDDPIFHLSNGRRARFEVEVDAGAVRLRGVVRTALDRRRADIVARALGATTVDNRLQIEDENAPRRLSEGRKRSPGARDVPKSTCRD